MNNEQRWDAGAAGQVRVRAVNAERARSEREWVVYWMIAARRPAYNHALDRAVALARSMDKPLLILEPLRLGYRWASDRIHTFVLQGMRDHVEAFASAPVAYYPYLEPEPDAGKGLLESVAARAAVVVTDDFPCFFLPRMVAAAGQAVDVRLEAVDGNGLLPMRATSRVFERAVDLRRWLQRNLAPHLRCPPREAPFDGVPLPRRPLPAAWTSRWPVAEPQRWLDEGRIATLDIDHEVPAVATEGGHRAAARALQSFLDERLASYGERRSRPEEDVSSRLSPYLHFGHVSAHQVLDRLAEREGGWTPARLNLDRDRGARGGWWGMSDSAEAYLDELVTWRELGYNRCCHTEGYDRYESLPAWARATLEEHAGDPREHVYTLEQLERGQTHDALWNAAQGQLRSEGRIHNYLRMLWGKKVLEWTRHPRDAVDILVELNNRWALDGRNPNSYSGIFWTLGRYDRAWGPERPIFGKIRYMTSRSTRAKFKVDDYISRYT